MVYESDSSAYMRHSEMDIDRMCRNGHAAPEPGSQVENIEIRNRALSHNQGQLRSSRDLDIWL